jgi:hypothetical protein
VIAAAAMFAVIHVGTALGQDAAAGNAEVNKESADKKVRQGVQRTRVDRTFNNGVQQPSNQPGYNVGVQRPEHKRNLQRMHRAEGRTDATSYSITDAPYTSNPANRMIERRDSASIVAAALAERRDRSMFQDRPSYSFRLTNRDQPAPSPIVTGREDLARVRGPQLIGTVNRDRSVDYLNVTTNRLFFGLKGPTGRQDLIEAKTGEWNMGFQNPDGTIDYMNPQTGRWDLAVPARGK